MNKISVADIRDILIIAGIFLFFTGWVYIYYFYDYFGISFSQVKIDYSSYLVYSFVVLTSFWYLPLVGIVVFVVIYNRWLKKYFMVSLVAGLILFPALYALARVVAENAASDLRNKPQTMRHISFVFRDDANYLSYTFCNDSLPGNNTLVKMDLSLLKDTGIPSQLYLLGQSDEYFYVLNQPAKSPVADALPFGSIFFINKKDVLYSKIIINSIGKE